eukprot:CAMPEP_0185703100 /NCGR_PEP_ID=MMETSP1164-20130828/13671_1 /TAXON_ID=1104430 /ORGANISM="Chrysoreinhardia sp, Strain CCMP2950" /LENGTH=50 /DNA_ID=CAMNT_0028370371 /DNA_START=402 /DNA_END=551 /DNA_ORIENTATION=+
MCDVVVGDVVVGIEAHVREATQCVKVWSREVRRAAQSEAHDEETERTAVV